MSARSVKVEEIDAALVTPNVATSVLGEEHVEQLSQQHHHTHNMVNLLEEKFKDMMEKFEHMRAENELQKQKLLEEQKKATKISLAAAVAANKVTSVLPQHSHVKATSVAISDGNVSVMWRLLLNLQSQDYTVKFVYL